MSLADRASHHLVVAPSQAAHSLCLLLPHNFWVCQISSEGASGHKKNGEVKAAVVIPPNIVAFLNNHPLPNTALRRTQSSPIIMITLVIKYLSICYVVPS